MQNRANPLFNNITPEQQKALMNCLSAKEKEYKAGQTICNYSEEDDLVGIVLDGEAYVERTDVNGYRTVLDRLPANSVFGRMVAFASVRDCVAVVCRKPCRILFINYKHITKRCAKACEYHSELVRNMISVITEKASVLAERIEVISHRNTREKLMCYFRMLAGEGTIAILPFNFSQLSEYICSDRSAMMREIRHMKEDGLIDVNKRTIKILKD